MQAKPSLTGRPECPFRCQVHVPCLTAADSPKLTVRQECAQLLTYLLYSLACKHLEGHVAGGTAYRQKGGGL